MRLGGKLIWRIVRVRERLTDVDQVDPGRAFLDPASVERQQHVLVHITANMLNFQFDPIVEFHDPARR